MSANQNVRAGKAEESGPLFKQPDAECIHCQQGVSLNADGMHMREDGLAVCARKPEPEAEAPWQQPSGPRCAFCDRGDKPSDDGFHIVRGEPRKCGVAAPISDLSNGEKLPEEPTRGPVLVDARDMGHRRNRRQGTRGDVAEAERSTPEDFVPPADLEPETETVQ